MVSEGRATEIQLVGGLGNQLFGLAAGRFLQDVCGHHVTFNTWHLGRLGYDHGASLVGRRLEDRFVSKPPLFRSSHKRITKLLRLPDKSYRSVDIGWDPDLCRVSPGPKVYGYFQSWRYASALHTVIKPEDLIPADGPSVWFSEELDLARQVRPVVAHLRRGDYQLLADSFGMVGPDFLEKAITQVRSAGIENPLWIFSDEPDYAQDIIQELRVPARIIYPPKGSDPGESLVLMGTGIANIISNSTFAWWGAFLNPSAEVVVGPNPWFKTLPEPRDLIPEDWVRVEHSFSRETGKNQDQQFPS